MIERSDSDRVAVYERDDIVYVAPLPRGPIAVLEGTAAVIWRAASSGPLETTADRVAETIGLEVAEIRDSVDDFVASLIAGGLIRVSQ